MLLARRGHYILCEKVARLGQRCCASVVTKHLETVSDQSNDASLPVLALVTFFQNQVNRSLLVFNLYRYTLWPIICGPNFRAV